MQMRHACSAGDWLGLAWTINDVSQQGGLVAQTKQRTGRVFRSQVVPRRTSFGRAVCNPTAYMDDTGMPVVSAHYKATPQRQPQLRPRRRRTRSSRRPTWLVAAVLALIVVCLSPTIVPPPPDWSSFAHHGASDVQALILTAHPDDECMFFSPTILSLRKQDVHVKSLCLSSGMLLYFTVVYAAHIFIPFLERFV